MKTALIAIAALLSAAPAFADGPMKVGTGYVIRYEKLDLSQSTDRQDLLTQIDRAATKVCAGLRPQTRRDTCKAVTAANAVASLQPDAQAAVQLARLERGGLQQAQR